MRIEKIGSIRRLFFSAKGLFFFYKQKEFWNDLVAFAVQESSDVIGGSKHDSAALVSCSALSPSEKKTAEIRSSAVVENVAPLADTIEIGGKAQSTSISSGENTSTKADRSFTFDVSPLVVNAKGEADKSITSTQASQLTEVCIVFYNRIILFCIMLLIAP